MTVLGPNNTACQTMQQVHTVFNSPIVSGPFSGLTTEYFQRAFYKDEFRLVVSDNLHTFLCECTHIRVVFMTIILSCIVGAC